MRQFEVRVKPGSKKGPLVEEAAGGDLTVYLRERPHQGSANSALVKLIAQYYDVPKTKIRIVKGLAARHKVIRIND